MNARRAHPVRAAIRPARPVTWIAGMVLTLSGCWISACIDIQGGAAEVSWSLRSQEGESIETCQEVAIRDVRLCWEPLADGSVLGAGGPCRSGRRRNFPCGESSGITAFDLDPGATAFWIEPVCDDGEPAGAGTYQVPPPIVRNVEDGQIVSLNSLLLVVSPPGGESPCPPAGCTCVRQ
jgi:hypothetical protein